MLILRRRERTLIGLALAGLLLVALYLYVVEPLVNRSAI
jgi:type II secretory pathway component PulM